MSIFERIGNSPQKEKETPKKETPKRLMYALAAWAEASAGKIDVRGMENLDKIPKDRKIIIATSHISDLDVLLVAYKLGRNFNLTVTNQSVHHHFFQEPPTNIGLTLTGKDNYLPIDYVKGEKRKEARFNPENFIPMNEAMEKGKTIIMAAHNPSQTGEGLEKSGVGVTYLSQLSDAIVLPVAINLKTNKPVGMYGQEFKTFLNRPDVDMTIGEPMELEKIEGIEFIAEAMTKRKSGERLSKEELEKFRNVIVQLKNQSGEIMKSIAKMLPEDKRGIFKVKDPSETESEVVN